nr:uncharacterized protein LOC117864671 isoform X3 [Setaria viridis]
MEGLVKGLEGVALDDGVERAEERRTGVRVRLRWMGTGRTGLGRRGPRLLSPRRKKGSRSGGGRALSMAGSSRPLNGTTRWRHWHWQLLAAATDSALWNRATGCTREKQWRLGERGGKKASQKTTSD